VELARSANARFEWRPDVQSWPWGGPIFEPKKDSLVLYSEALLRSAGCPSAQ
jgi:hypothetical protein